MIVQCTQCSTKFRINDANVGPRGAKVRCSRCQNVFMVAPVGTPVKDDEDASNHTRAFDASQFMRAAGTAVGTSTTDATVIRKPAGDETNVVDVRALAKAQPAPTTSHSWDDPVENSTRVMVVPDSLRIPERPERNEPPDTPTRLVVGGTLPSLDKAQNAAALFADDASWNDKSQETPAPFNLTPSGPAPAAPAPPGRPPRTSAAPVQLGSESTVQAAIETLSVEAVAMPPPPAASWVISGLSALLLLTGAVFSVRADALYAAMAVRQGLVSPVFVDETVVQGLRLVDVRTQVYPLTTNKNVWLVSGMVENTSQNTVRDVDVVIALHDKMNRVVEQAAMPVGVELDPSEIPDEAEALKAVISRALKQNPPPGLDAQGQGNFVAVVLDVPTNLPRYVQTVRLAQRPAPPPEPVVPPEPAAPPAAVVPVPTPVAAQVLKDKNGHVKNGSKPKPKARKK